MLAKWFLALLALLAVLLLSCSFTRARMVRGGAEVQESVRLKLQPRLEAILRCALCHDALAPPESVCSRCFTRLHAECRAVLARCPTLGCVPIVRARAPNPDLGIEDRWFDRIGCSFPAVMVVLVLFVLLACIFSGPWCGNSHTGKVGATLAQIASFEEALDFFEADCGRYPTSAEGLDALRNMPSGVNGWKGPYMKKAIPVDPWGDPYRYVSPGTSGAISCVASYDLSSAGPDGQHGTVDDICSWAMQKDLHSGNTH